jgi:hypothetical protein
MFTDGFVFNRDWVVVASQLEEAAEEEYEHSRIFTYKNGAWMHFDLNLVINSVCGAREPAPALYCMARGGEINVQRKGGAAEEEIEDAGTGRGSLGYVTRLRQIGGRLYACGVAGQIYRRGDDGAWSHFDRSVLDPQGPPKALDLYCIDGTSESDIYAVGQRGLLWHFDGKMWTRLDSPTRSDINWVRCVSPSEVYLCGNRGGFFRGSRRDGWQDFSVEDMREEFWCVEHFRGGAYLAAISGVFAFDGARILRVESKPFAPTQGHRLHAADGVLWSFGIDELSFYDGNAWAHVPHPDNP